MLASIFTATWKTPVDGGAIRQINRLRYNEIISHIPIGLPPGKNIPTYRGSIQANKIHSQRDKEMVASINPTI